MPRVETPETSSGVRTLVVDGRYFHSRYDPLKEAERLAADASGATLAVFMSPGLGYLADILRRGGTRLLVVERHDEIARLRPDLDPFISPGPEAVGNALMEIEGWETGRVAILAGVMRDEDRSYYETIRAAVDRAIDARSVQAATVRAFESVWERNMAANRALIERARRGVRGDGGSVGWVTGIGSAWKGRTVLVLAAGPSLAGDLEVLARLSGPRPVLFAVDSALPAVLAAGITPDAVCTVDPQPVKRSSLAALGAIPLLASVLSPPEILDCAKVLMLFGQGHPSEGSLGIPDAATFRELGGSVATAAATLAAGFGASCIGLVGQDLAFQDRVTHVRGTHHETARVGGMSRFRSGERAAQEDTRRRKLRPVPSVDGRKVWTTPALDSYRLYFLDLASRHPEIRFVQTSPWGARIGVETRSLAELLKTLENPADRMT